MPNSTNTIIEDLTLVPVPEWWQNPWVIAVAAILLGAIVWGVARWWHARPRAQPARPRAPDGPPPHLEALRRLADLRARHSRTDAYGVALECSDILRTYVEGRFALPIRYQTTREFIVAVQSSSGLEPSIRTQLGEFLQFFDQLKFARAAATSEQTLRTIDESERLVRTCIPPDLSGGQP